MFTLPEKINTTMLFSFWAVLTTTVTIGIVLVSWLVSGSVLSLLMLFIVPLLQYPVYRNPEIAVKPYIQLNRVFRLVERVALNASLKIIHYLFMVSFIDPKSELSKSLKMVKTNSWVERNKGIEKDESFDNGIYFPDDEEMNEFRCFKSWISYSGKWRYLPLVPILIIISKLSGNVNKETVPEDMYTLY